MARPGFRAIVVLAVSATAIVVLPARVQAQARPAQPAPPPAVPPEGYTYAPDGRRDPFVSLLGRGSEPREGSKRGEGLAGMLTTEITLRGTMLSRGQYVGLVQGADGKTYIVRPNDRLLDGVVRSITATEMIIRQQVNDPLSLEKQREIRKPLRPGDDVK